MFELNEVWQYCIFSSQNMGFWWQWQDRLELFHFLGDHLLPACCLVTKIKESETQCMFVFCAEHAFTRAQCCFSIVLCEGQLWPVFWLAVVIALYFQLSLNAWRSPIMAWSKRMKTPQKSLSFSIYFSSLLTPSQTLFTTNSFKLCLFCPLKSTWAQNILMDNE